MLSTTKILNQNDVPALKMHKHTHQTHFIWVIFSTKFQRKCAVKWDKLSATKTKNGPQLHAFFDYKSAWILRIVCVCACARLCEKYDHQDGISSDNKFLTNQMERRLTHKEFQMRNVMSTEKENQNLSLWHRHIIVHTHTRAQNKFETWN